MSSRGKNVLVTGGAGFIGSWLCERLVKAGYKVTCLDNFCSGSTQNLEHLDIEVIAHDVRQPIELDAGHVFHLASRASPTDFPRYPVEILTTNSLGTYNTLKLAEQNNARYLLASTSEVYGDALQHPQNEEYWGNVNPVGPRACYDESKRFAEALAMAWHRKNGLDIRIARIFNTYGERMRSNDGRAVPNLINQALENEPMTVYGDGTQTRSFCYVSDLVDGLMELMFRENLGGEVINLGNPSEVSILAVATLIKALTASKSQIVFQARPQDDPARRSPAVAKAKKKLRWEPKVSLETGLRKTIEYFKATE